MATVTIKPLPDAYRELDFFWPVHPPIFDGPPSAADIATALALIEGLDPQSRLWYRSFYERHKHRR